ncbi:MAG: Rrf2 family transcriptional regulator [Phycisphaerales bacterium]|jgi:Rrf2 family protein
MKLSTRTRYGVRAIIELAVHYGQGPLQIKVIGQRQEISVKYLEQLMTILKSGGFIRRIRGSKGGYILARPPEQIKLDDIFLALEGSVSPAECVEEGGYCARAADCVTRELWIEVQKAIIGVLESVTLKDLIEKVKEQQGKLSYQI